MAKQFVNAENVWPIWDKIDELYLRKKDIEGNVKNEITLDLDKLVQSISPNTDLSNHNYVNITEKMYISIEQFINDYASKKYIKDKHNVYSIIGEIKNDGSLTEYDGITIKNQTDKLLIAFNNSVYFLWAIKLNTTEQGGELGSYRIIQELFIDSITDDFINELQNYG